MNDDAISFIETIITSSLEIYYFIHPDEKLKDSIINNENLTSPSLYINDTWIEDFPTSSIVPAVFVDTIISNSLCEYYCFHIEEDPQFFNPAKNIPRISFTLPWPSFASSFSLISSYAS